MQWFAFPLVFLRPGHVFSLRPVLLKRRLPQGHRPACVFKFFSQVDDVVGVSVGRDFFLSVFVLLLASDFFILSLSLFFLLRDKDQANRSRSPPARFVGLVPFFSFVFLPCRCLSPFACPPVSAVCPSVSAFFRGAFLGPLRFFGFPELGA